MIRGNAINPNWFELYNSRGLETSALKSFMRFTVIISDYVLYIPALLAYSHFAIPQGRKIDKVYLA
jgi:alpha-1,3-glucosyltransferase